MQIRVLDDRVEIEGYVNAVERNSRPLRSRIGTFIERIRKGAFSRALERNDNVRILLNHDPKRDLGGTKDGNLNLVEDSIGLRARAVVTDEEVVKKGREGKLVGWSFGFYDVENGVDKREENGIPLREVSDMDLREVSILDDTHTPAYEGTLIAVREDSEEAVYYSAPLLSDPEVILQTRDEASDPAPQIDDKQEPIDYSKFEALIAEMKGA